MRALPLLLALQGCWYVDDARFESRVEDYDGDGGIATRFGGDDCLDDDPSVPDCDVDDDGALAVAVGGDDCDDEDAFAVPGTPWFIDVDRDGYGDPDAPTTGCGAPPEGMSENAADCDDEDVAINPSATERCDGVDQNCDGAGDSGATDATVQAWADGDDDGYGAGGVVLICELRAGVSTLQGDCDDNDADVFPAAPEVWYDGVDQDCAPGNEYDADGDGFEATVAGGTDCDDQRSNVYPGAPEACDGLDNDCDQLTDDEEDDDDQVQAELIPLYRDVDGDGHGGALQTARFCPDAAPPGWSRTSLDCDDRRPNVNPDAVEWCNGVDDDCDGLTDDGSAADAFPAFPDADGDGFGDGGPTEGVLVCALDGQDIDGDHVPDALATRFGDCRDDDPLAWPGAPEICGDAVRQDCSTRPADDCDGDGAVGAADCNDDPADQGAEMHPGAVEVCDGVDNDCDGLTDDADPGVVGAGTVTWYLDADRDGHGSNAVLAANTCARPPSAAAVADDCDDLDDARWPGAPERCDAVDNDCDGAVDEDATDLVTRYADRDGDGFGATADLRCANEAGWVAVPGDCDDDDDGIYPFAGETCADRIDNDCDGLVDAEDPDANDVDVWYPDDDDDGLGDAIGVPACGAPAPGWTLTSGDCDDADPTEGGPSLWFADADRDGWASAAKAAYGCRPASTEADWSRRSGDCDDERPEAHPGADEVCNFRDDDCDGVFDEEPAGLPERWQDQDGDGYGSGSPQPPNCFEQHGATAGGDCDDTRSNVSPGLTERCDDLDDNDCDPDTSATCSASADCVGWQWPDHDRDGWGDPQSTPTYDCALNPGASTVPADCNDADGSAYGTPQVFDVTDASSLNAAIQATGCRVARLAPDLDLTWYGSLYRGNLTITSADPARPGTLRHDATTPITADNGTDGLVLHAIRLAGTSTSPRFVANPGAGDLYFIEVEVDGGATGEGLIVQDGQLHLYDVQIHDATSGTLDGGALYVGAEATVEVDGLEVYASSGVPSSVGIDAASSPTLRRLRVYDSGRVAFYGGVAASRVTLDDVQIWDAQSGGVTVNSGALYNTGPARLSLHRGLIVRSAMEGITTLSGGFDISHTAVVASASAGVKGGPGSAGNFVDSYAIGHGAVYKDVAVQGGGSLRGSWANSSQIGFFMDRTGMLTAPPQPITWATGAVTEVAGAPGVELWDFHLQAGSPGRGTALNGEDVGYYAAGDPWYADKDADDLPDGWEDRWFRGDADPMGDPDGDGLDNLVELTLGSCPVAADTDGDGAPDDTDAGPLNPLL